MQRIAIIGNAGGGKSLLARDIGRALQLPVHALDDVQWQAGWQSATSETVAAAHAKWLASPRWIIEGWGGPESIAERLHAADTIILVDFPRRVHVFWALKRQVLAVLGLTHHWPPDGCSAWGMTRRVLRLIRYVDRHLLPQVRTLIDRESDTSHVIHLRSPRELRAFRRTLRTPPPP